MNGLAPFTYLVISFISAGCLISARPVAAARVPNFGPPYLRRGAGAAGRQALRRGAYKTAAKHFRSYLRGKHRKNRKQAHFLLAYALLKEGNPRISGSIFRRLIRSYPLLINYHRLYAAKGLARAKEFSAARRLARAIPTTSPLHRQAIFVLADIEWALDRPAIALQLWQGYLTRRSRRWRRDDCHFRSGEALERLAEQQPDHARTHYQEAVTHFRKILYETPLSPRVNRAIVHLKRISALLAQDGYRINPTQLTPTEKMQKLETLFAKSRYKNALATAESIQLPRSRKFLSAKQICKATYIEAKSLYHLRHRKRAVAAFTRSEARCRSAGDDELQLKSLYNRGRALANLGQPAQAAQTYLLLESRFPRHSYADDARFRAATAYLDLGRPAEARKLFNSLPKRYPRGDMTPRAQWRLAFADYKAGRGERALARLKEQSSSAARKNQRRALYWQGRILEQRGRLDAAATAYTRVVREHPLTYYALVAFTALRTLRPRQYNTLRRSLLGYPIPSKRRHRIRVSRRLSHYFRTLAVRRGIELARLGFANSAAAQFAASGLRLTKHLGKDLVWPTASLYDRAHLWQVSHRLPTKIREEFRREYPRGRNYRQWSIAYPLAFAKLTARWTRRAKIPRWLALAVMREESGFSPRIESYANALGLMQLLVPTAKAVGARISINPTRESLKQPEENIRVGSAYLGGLARRFHRIFPLVIAAYNAGGAAVSRWVHRARRAGGGKRKGPRDHGIRLDEFIESIPYNQTRGYTKRVLESFFIYHALYARPAARIPKIPLRI